MPAANVIGNAIRASLRASVVLTGRLPDCRLFILDADFEYYRRNGHQVIPPLRPE